MKEAKAKVAEWLEENIGTEHYVSDIGMEITESENRDGYWFANYPDAVKAAIGNWGLSQYVVDYGKEELDSDYGKMFWEDPDKFWVICMIILCEHIWNKLVEDLKLDSDDEIEISEKLVKRAESALKKYEYITQVGMVQ